MSKIVNFKLNDQPEGYLVPFKVEKFYNRSVRSWYVQVLDRYDNQIGESIYVYSKSEAEYQVDFLEREYGLNK